MIRALVAFAGLLLLAACEPPAPPPDHVAEDSARCAQAGFAPGSPEMAKCMATASNERQNAANLAAAKSAQDAAIRQRNAELQAKKDGADQAAWDRELQQNRDEAAAMMARDPIADASAMPAMPDMTPQDTMRPTAAGIPGMDCTGVGDDASCDALSSY